MIIGEVIGAAEEYDRGRPFYTALGQNGSDYSDNPDFRIMSEQAILREGGLIDITQDNGLAEETAGNHESHDQGFLAYPNPANDLLTIRSEGVENVELKLLSMTGTLAMEVNGKSGLTLCLSNLYRGLYLLQVNQEGERNQVKILKE